MIITPRNMLTGALAAGMFATSGLAVAGDEVKIDQVPPAVRQTIERQKGAGTIDEIERETENGVVVYEVEIKRDGREHEFRVREDGTLMPERRRDRVEGAVRDVVSPLKTGLTLDQVPAAVRQTVQAQLQGGKVDEIERETENGRIFYEVEIERPDGTEIEIHVAEDGTLLPREGRTGPTPKAAIGARTAITTSPAVLSR